MCRNIERNHLTNENKNRGVEKERQRKNLSDRSRPLMKVVTFLQVKQCGYYPYSRVSIRERGRERERECVCVCVCVEEQEENVCVFLIEKTL